MTVFYYHLIWFLFLFLSFGLFLFLSLFVSFSGQSIFVSWSLFSVWNLDIQVSFLFDFVSLWFSTIILLISSVIIVYSYFYIAPYSNPNYFLWFTFLFVVSMLLVVTIANMFFLMLGWDGLGLISFFLIVYYQNHSSITSGVFTLLINRLGDSLFIFSLVLFFYSYSDFSFLSSGLSSSCLVLFLVGTFITNSAIFPFSPWLPLAMAAPTPISALVHSSTLVTAGLYLIIRFSYLLHSSVALIQLLVCLSIFTSFYAGINTLVEYDLNNLIALSTLSHLGFIGMAYSCGLVHLAFFHMLTHALFNSLLFMTMGDIMINLNHSQDIRYLSSGFLYTPFSCIIINVSLLNLLGIPFISGFYSNDLILELLNYSNSSAIAVFLVYINVFFTYFYTFQLFFYSFQSNKLNPFQTPHAPVFFHSLLLSVMAVATFGFGVFFMTNIHYSLLFLAVPLYLKFYPFLLMLSFFLFLTIFLHFPSTQSSFLNSYFSSMLYLHTFMQTLTSRFYVSFLFSGVNSLELGLLNSYLNSIVPKAVLTSSVLIYNLSTRNPFFSIIFFSFLAVLFFV